MFAPTAHTIRGSNHLRTKVKGENRSKDPPQPGRQLLFRILKGKRIICNKIEQGEFRNAQGGVTHIFLDTTFPYRYQLSI